MVLFWDVHGTNHPLTYSNTKSALYGITVRHLRCILITVLGCPNSKPVVISK